jgi:hypothetical protein
VLHALTFAAYTITLDGQVVLPRAQAAVTEGHVLLPVRALGEAIGADIGYDRAARSITIQRGALVSVIPVRDAVRIVNGHAYAPLRMVATAFGMFVSYDAPSRTVALDQRATPVPVARASTPAPTVAVVSGSMPFTITETPPNGAQIHEPYPAISARFAGATAIDTRSLHVEVDGRDVTPYASVVGDQVLYTPRTALAPGQHYVAISARDISGTPVERAWSFGDNFAFVVAPQPTPFPVSGFWIDRWITPGTNAFDVFVEGAPGITGFVWIEGIPKYYPLNVYTANSYVAHVFLPNGVNQPFARVAARLTLPNGITQTIEMPQTFNLLTPAVVVPTPVPTPTPRPMRRPVPETPSPLPRRPLAVTPAPKATPTASPTPSPAPTPTATPVRIRRPLIRKTPAPSPSPAASQQL